MNDRSPSVVVDAVSLQALKQPAQIAAVLDDDSVTYLELEIRASQLCDRLKAMEANRGQLVAVRLKRSPAFVIAALGVLKSGAAYLPIDMNYPDEGLRELLHDAQVSILITDEAPARPLNLPGMKIVQIGNIREDSCARSSLPFPAPQIEISPSDLAYVIYTSGSTGKPKGVEVTHGNLMNLVRWHNREFEVTQEDRASQMAGLGFDASVWEIWPHLAAGATVDFAPEKLRSNPEGLQKWLVQRKITVSFVPTPLAEYLIRWPWPTCTSLRALLTGGDTLHHHPERNLPFRVFNNYGPTECTVVATSCELTPADGNADLPPIGRPIANARIHILDETLRPVAPGDQGEIYVGGAGVARGYRLRADLSSERFLLDPFAPRRPGAELPRMYKTGDLGRYLPDGQIEFLGRADAQVKIRGYRIEPHQIARTIETYPFIRSALVTLAQWKANEKALVAYVVLKQEMPIGDSELRGFLAARLPAYMVPSVFVAVENLPLTGNGKIDCARLPKPTPANILRGAPAASPAETGPGEVTMRVAEMLAGLLDVEQVSADDNFFMLGGHSLLGAQLIARIRDAFGVDLGLKTLFDAPTVALLAAEIEKQLALRTIRKPDVHVARMPHTSASGTSTVA